MFGSLVNLGFLWWKRHSHPINFVLLGTFTLLESITLGTVVGFYDQVIVLQALLITLGVFLGLTLFTYQSKVRHVDGKIDAALTLLPLKYDFSGMAPFLFGGLMVLRTSLSSPFLAYRPLTFSLVMTGLVGIFIPFNETMDLIYAIGGMFILCYLS